MTSRRRSPRTISRFNNGCLINPADSTEEGNKLTAIILALCECTDLSCDSIMVRIREFFSSYYAVEKIWDLRWKWINKKVLAGGITDKDVELMIAMAKEVNIQTPGLHSKKDTKFSVKPKTVRFASYWSQSMDVLCDGFGIKTRDFTKKWLLRKNRAFRMLGLVTDYERDVIEQFGQTVEGILKSTLSKWSIDALAALNGQTEASGRPHEPIDIDGQVVIIMDHIEYFQEKWERVFGRLESAGENYRDENNIVTMAIPSTAYGAKVLIGMMMSDRIAVLNRLRCQARKEGEEYLKLLDHIKVNTFTLDEDNRMCPVCRQTMGIKDPDGVIIDDIGIRMPCCRQIIGAFCIRRWLRRVPGRFSNKSCPICRHKCPECFIDRIFEGHEEEEDGEDEPEFERDVEGRVVIDLISPDQSPRPQTEHVEDVFTGLARLRPDISMDYLFESEIVPVTLSHDTYISESNHFDQQPAESMGNADNSRPGDYDFANQLGAGIEPIPRGQEAHFDIPIPSIELDNQDIA